MDGDLDSKTGMIINTCITNTALVVNGSYGSVDLTPSRSSRRVLLEMDRHQFARTVPLCSTAIYATRSV